nr:uncharacterized protein LOC116428257 [Nomia melanderi]
MTNPLKMVNRFLTVINYSLIVIDKSRKSSKLFKCKKSFSAAGHKSTSNTIIQDRLMGGADISEAVENRSGVVTENIKESASTHAVDQEKDTSNLQNGRPATSGGPCCSCIAQVPGAIGDQKVDEMIDFVHQNLQEAGKALATLSENFEHDSKLMFVDILGRIQQWTSSVEKKLEDCKKALELMRKELMARLCEIENLKKQLTDCEAARNTEREKQQVSHQTQHQMQHQTQVEQHVEERAVVTETPKEQESVLIPVVEQRIKEPVDQFVAQSPAAQEPKVIEIVCTDAAIQSTMKDKERMRREIELEAEITRLKKENQRIVKERAEYENAIQRALLRGVSCLNVEALRVLRSPPIPCCTPCTPCPTDNTLVKICLFI